MAVVTVILSSSTYASATSPAIPIDFSYAGYGAGQLLPRVRAVIAVKPSGADDTALLQVAIDHVSSLPLGADGFRGAVLLLPGRFRVIGRLEMRVSGVVLRGSGAGANGTTIIAAGRGRRTLIELGGVKAAATGKPVPVVADAPAGSTVLAVERVSDFSVGTRVVITRPSTAEWIAALGMSKLPGTFADQRLDWKPGSHNLVWDRTVLGIDTAKSEIRLDAPITTALEKAYGGGAVSRSETGVPSKIGIEDLALESESDSANPKDEEHSWIAVQLDHVEDAWVRNVTARHFAGSAVMVNRRARRVTIEGCRSETPVSELAGYRRRAFLVKGQQVLVYRCWSEGGMNDFASGLLAAGPNVFLDCRALHSMGSSGSSEGWASGVLYERVHVPDSRIQLMYDMSRAQGGGWTAANSVVWNSSAQSIDVMSPPGAPTLAVESSKPLYEEQLFRRTGHRLPPAPVRGSLTQSAASVPLFSLPRLPKPQPRAVHELTIVNGRFVIDGLAIWGGSVNEAWWKGEASPAVATTTGRSVTRFLPGEVGPGMTEDLPQLAAFMKDNYFPFFQAGPGLWYDRRRDEHTVRREENGNVWAPFYEMPWARSGKGQAWDGLSRFDLRRFNPWFFERHREFADLAAENGLIIYFNLYNTHNVLEIGPHWIDYPWRPANNVNDTGLPDPPPMEPRGRLHLGSEFYNVDDPRMRDLHRQYILHVLDQLGDKPNLVFEVAFQYAGPLKFQQFFLDTVREWEARHGRTVKVGLTTSKDQTDAILSDPMHAKQIRVIDTRYWQYRPDGTLWAPAAGQNLAYRELISAHFPGSTDRPPATTPLQTYRQVREYRDRFPDKAVVALENGSGPIPILMAGGAQSLVGNPAAGQSQALSFEMVGFNALLKSELAADLPRIAPVDGLFADPDHTWALAGGKSDPVLVYSLEGKSVALDGSLPAARYSGSWIDPRTLKKIALENVVRRQQGTVLEKPSGEDWLLLLRPVRD